MPKNDVRSNLTSHFMPKDDVRSDLTSNFMPKNDVRSDLTSHFMPKQFIAIQCNAMEFSTSIQFDAIQLKSMQFDTIQCNSMGFNANCVSVRSVTANNEFQCHSMQFNAFQCNSINSLQFEVIQCNPMSLQNKKKHPNLLISHSQTSDFMSSRVELSILKVQTHVDY
jgi:hypothetical protein